ncbi:hypothetical protein D3C81_1228570 [compost metagenome]
MKFLALSPVVHQHAFLRCAVGQQQAAVIAGFTQVLIDLVLAFVGVDEVPALVQVVPVDLAPMLLNLRRLAGVAQVACHSGVLACVSVSPRLVVERPDEAWQLLTGLSALLGQRLK